ncbi:MAG: hypothetical protein HRT94_09745 [Alphaproteobacteria bacterium]|nr:hypothetical protein [Alphaproteobacteria bacterium]
MVNTTLHQISKDVAAGLLVPYIGPGALDDVVSQSSGKSIPADSNSLILAMNDGKPMAKKLMYEFSRAVINRELKEIVLQFLVF